MKKITYQFDWKTIVYGSIKIDAKDGLEADEIFKSMTIEELNKLSQTHLSNEDIEIRFVKGDTDEEYSSEEWDKFGRGLE